MKKWNVVTSLDPGGGAVRELRQQTLGPVTCSAGAGHHRVSAEQAMVVAWMGSLLFSHGPVFEEASPTLP